MHYGIQRTLRVALTALAAAIFALSFGSGPVSATLEPGAAFAYSRSEAGKSADGVIKIWVQEKALLLEFSSKATKVTRLVRPDGTLLIQETSANKSYAFYGKPYLGVPLTLPLQWASHSLLGVPTLDQAGKRLTWTDLSSDPRRDRAVTGDATLDQDGRVRSLYWPSREKPEGSLTVSGWEDMGAGIAPKRLDEETQKNDASLAVYWELSHEPPMPRAGEDFTFEGLLAHEVKGGQSILSITDCRVSIESCPVFPYRPELGGLVDQLGSAGHGSLTGPKPNTAAAVVLSLVAVLLLLGMASYLRKKKAPEVK